MAYNNPFLVYKNTPENGVLEIQYDYLNDKFFNVYKPTKFLPVILRNSLGEDLDISDWAENIVNGTPIVRSILLKQPEQLLFVFNNNPEYEGRQQNTQPAVQQIEIEELPTVLQVKKPTHIKSTLNKEQQTKALLVMNGLIKRKINPIHAAGIVGNLMGESGRNLNTGAYNSNDVGAPAGGLAGWRGDNFTKLKNLALSRGKHWTDLDTQLDYLISTIPSNVSNRLAKAKNPFDASEAWAYYEKYAGYNNSIESARKFQKSRGWSDERTKKWIADNHKARGEMSEEIYNLWLANK